MLLLRPAIAADPRQFGKRVGASPKQQYGRNLRSIRRIRKGTRGMDPNATSIDVNSDAFHGP